MAFVAYWPLNENSDGTAYDYSGNENHSSSTSGVIQGVSGILGQTSYSFGGSDEITSKHNLTFDAANTEGFTVNAWFQPNFTPSDGNRRGIVSFHPNDSNNWRIRWDGRKEKWQWGWSNTNPASGDLHNSGEWYMMTMTVTRDGSNLIGYWNGKREVSASNVDSCSATDDVVIGNDTLSSYYFDGKISEVRIYDRALTASEVQYLYSVGKRGLQTTDMKSS